MGTINLTRATLVRKIVRALLFIFSLIFPSTVFPQLHDPFGTEKFQFDKLEHVKGLENRTIGSIVQDDYGFIWFGTAEGLIRFDGYEIRVYKNDLNNDNSLASNSIQGLTKDKSGNLWIATQGGGLDKFEIATERFTHYQHDPADSTSIVSNSLLSVMVDSRGMIWTGTFSTGLNVLDPTTNKFRRVKEERYFPVRAIKEDRSGMIWFSSHGINRVDPVNLSLKAFPPDASETAPISTGEIRSVYQDKTGKFWIAVHDEETIFLFEETTGKYKPFSLYGTPAAIYTFCEDNMGRIWVATSNGVAIVDGEQISYFRAGYKDTEGLGKKTILSMYSDKEGALWLGTEGSGVDKVHNGKKFFTFRYSETEGLQSHRLVRSFCEDSKGRIWMGWVAGGVDIFDPRTNSLTKFNTNVDNISCIYYDKDGTVWIAGWGTGLFHYTAEGKKIAEYKSQNTDQSLPDNRVQAMLRDHNDVLWVGTENGLSQFDEKRNEWKPVKKPYFSDDLLGTNIQSLAMIEAPDGTIWAGTWSGLNSISPDRKTIKHYSSGSEINTSAGFHVISLCLDSKNGVLWIGTFESGLSRMNLHTGDIIQVTIANGLPSNTIFGIHQDEGGNLWLSTTNGLAKYNPDTGRFRNYDADDGLQGNEFFWGGALKMRDGKMIFGGANGITMFNPAEIIDKTSIPAVVLTDFEIFNKPVAIGDMDSLLTRWLPDTKEITLSYEQSVFTFSFAALDFTRPQKNQYAYMLEDFDKDWNYVGNKRTATYTNIDPGEYTFRVKASNSDGVWNEEGVAIIVTITPPFWLTWWFKTISVIFVIGSLLTFYLVRIGIANRQRTVLEHQVTQRTREITAKNLEILSQMEKVKLLSEELAQQRDNIEQQNSLLATSKAELENKVQQRTNELSLSNSELTRQNLQLEQFAFMTAHNLRSPVARLLGLTSIFNLENPSDPLNIEVIRRIQNSAMGLDEVIRDIADILQVQKGTHQKLETLMVMPAIQRALKTLNSEINEQKIDIINNVDPTSAIYGIPPYVHSVFYNIISNAVKYADTRKKPHIEITSVQNNGHLSVTFSDNGIGFDRKNLKEKLFKPFSRLNSYGDGKGLGLYLVKIEMESMNGEIDIQSEVDNGTLVTLKFRAYS